ncbi:uncharacterized protein LOC130048758 [Ostrea edulis]|uniref:uncharacterized protein LOC130048758 n=1 Tax=Ostrea edulis TaxID=37623 RepID=UPI0024AFE23A|nr:uncharacterized protein LOC130048758 [Ostrea edulis]
MFNSISKLVFVLSFFLSQIVFAEAETRAGSYSNVCTSYCNTSVFHGCQCKNGTMSCERESVGIILMMNVTKWNLNSSCSMSINQTYNGIGFCRTEIDSVDALQRIPPGSGNAFARFYFPESDFHSRPLVTFKVSCPVAGVHTQLLFLENVFSSKQSAPKNTLFLGNNSETSLWVETEIQVYYDCFVGENQVCNKSGHVGCAPNYYGSQCQRYCYSAMFENCTCNNNGDLICRDESVGAFFEIQLLTTHISKEVENSTYTLTIDQR